MIRRVLFPESARKAPPAAGAMKRAARNSKGQRQVQEIMAAFEAAGGNMGLTAKALGIDRSTLWRRMKRNGLLF
jgi:transcriptional regulator of acetoin/glycerol metabolism